MDKYSTLPWIEKYRPKTLDEVISHSEVVHTLRTFMKNKCLPHLLFYGPPGTGKTSVIMACAKEMYGEYHQFMVMELNASDDRGIEVVRNKIKQFVTSDSVFFGKTEKDRTNIYKLVILDEIDAMTKDAQAILRKVVEKYTYNTRFCLICNYIQNLIPALQSRCTRFRFSPLDSKHIRHKVYEVVAKENIHVTETGITTIIKHSNGDMRKILNGLQSVSMAYDLVDENNVNTCFGYPRRSHIDAILDTLLTDNFASAYEKIAALKKENGLSLDDIVQEIHNELVEFIIDGETINETVNKLNKDRIARILDRMRMIEYNQSINTVETIQLSALPVKQKKKRNWKKQQQCNSDENSVSDASVAAVAAVMTESQENSDELNQIVEDDPSVDNGSHHKLDTKYTLWAHDIHNKNWNLESYIRVCEIDNVSSCWKLLNNFDKRIGMRYFHFFLMREGIDPIWEHESNRNGGVCSLRVELDRAANVWEDLCSRMVCNVLNNNPNDINGISISPKSGWAIIKVWNHDNKNDLSKTMVPEILEKYVDLSIKYRSNEPEY